MAHSFGLAPAFPSAGGLYQGLPFYPALAYRLDGDRIDSANFRIVGVFNCSLSGSVYRSKVAGVGSKQRRRNAWGTRFGKIADAEFHAHKIKRLPSISNGRDGSLKNELGPPRSRRRASLRILWVIRRGSFAISQTC